MISSIKVLLHRLALVSVGIFLATFEIGGRTPFEHGIRAWKRHVTSSRLDYARERMGEFAVDTHDQIIGDDERPRERHGPTDRAAVDRIIAKGAR